MRRTRLEKKISRSGLLAPIETKFGFRKEQMLQVSPSPFHLVGHIILMDTYLIVPKKAFGAEKTAFSKNGRRIIVGIHGHAIGFKREAGSTSKTAVHRVGILQHEILVTFSKAQWKPKDVGMIYPSRRRRYAAFSLKCVHRFSCPSGCPSM